MSRIKRIGFDANTNYTFLATSAYNAAAPAATTSPWPDSAAMDQRLDQASPTEVTEQGVLVTFVRFPDTFAGAIVKVKPTYDTGAGEKPALELWTHDSVTLEWTKRRRIDLTNLFVGTPSGERHIFDLTFFPWLTTVDKVWITMDPGAVGSPTMVWDTIQLYGQCTAALQTPNPPGDIDADPCIFHPFSAGCLGGFDPCSLFPSLCEGIILPPLDICSPASVAVYENALLAIPGALEQFQAWLAEFAAEITAFCAGNGPEPPPVPIPGGTVPTLPALDLCDSVSVDAFRAALAGNATAIADFDAFLEVLREAGYFTLVCQPPDPKEDPPTPTPPAGTTPSGGPGDGGPGAPPAGGAGPGGAPAAGAPESLRPPPARRSPIPAPPAPTTVLPVTTEVRRIFVAATVTTTDTQIWNVLKLANGGQPADSICVAAGNGQWPIVRLPASLSSVVYRVRYDGFLNDAIVDAFSARSTRDVDPSTGPGTAAAPVFSLSDPTFYFADRLTPSGGGLVDGTHWKWEGETTGSDFTLTASPDNFGKQAVCLRVDITQSDAVDNLRIEIA